MPGALRKMGLYLGLVEDDEHDRYDESGDSPEPTVAAARRPAPQPHVAPARRSFEEPSHAAFEAAPRPVGVPAVDEGYRITTLHPHSYNDARAIGENFRVGTPVIMNLTEMDDTDAKRLVDFAAGLIFGLHGRIERVTNKVFLLSPEHVEVTAEDRARIVEAGFFNQS